MCLCLFKSQLSINPCHLLNISGDPGYHLLLVSVQRPVGSKEHGHLEAHRIFFSVHHRFDEKIIRTFNRVNQSLGYRWTVYKVYKKLFHVVNIFSQFRLCKCWYGQWDDPGSENDQINNCLKPISKKMKTWAKNTSFSPGAFTSSEKVLRAPTQRVQAPLRPEFLQMSAGCVVGAP